MRESLEKIFYFAFYQQPNGVELLMAVLTRCSVFKEQFNFILLIWSYCLLSISFEVTTKFILPHSFIRCKLFFEVFRSYFACLASLFSRPELEYTIGERLLTTPFSKK